jgi:CHASE3 domain sensor protein
MAAKQITFDVQRLIAEVAARHKLLLRPDDAAFAIVTMNRLVLEESLETVHTRIIEELSTFENAAQKVQTRAGVALAADVRQAAAAIRAEIQQDVETARLQATKLVQQVDATYRRPLSAQRFTIMALAGLLLFFCGACAGRISTHWWPF